MRQNLYNETGGYVFEKGLYHVEIYGILGQ